MLKLWKLNKNQPNNGKDTQVKTNMSKTSNGLQSQRKDTTVLCAKNTAQKQETEQKPGSKGLKSMLMHKIVNERKDKRDKFLKK